jgi:hypothetical protein
MLLVQLDNGIRRIAIACEPGAVQSGYIRACRHLKSTGMLESTRSDGGAKGTQKVNRRSNIMELCTICQVV